MNLSGLSYLQFLMVDALICIYLFLRIYETKAWSTINPLFVLRMKRRVRSDAVVRMLGFYSCTVALVLFMVRDGIMTSQEIQDVNLCRRAVYTNQPVTPLDSQQLSDIKVGLHLWDIGNGFILLALGLVMQNWASAAVQQLLGRNTLISTSTGRILSAFGGVGFIATVAVNFATFATESNASVARSITRLVITCFMLVFWVILCWTLLRVNRIIHQTRTRDPSATAAVVAASRMPHNEKNPLSNIIYLLGMQTLSFMKGTGLVMAVVLFVRVVVLLAFDIDYLTPRMIIANKLAAGNTLTGIGNLATSILAATIVQILFPWRQDVVAEVLEKVAILDKPLRNSFLGTQKASSLRRPSDLTSTFTSREPSTSIPVVPYLRQVPVPDNGHTATEKPPPKGPSPAPSSSPSNQSAPQSGNYIQKIPYIDRQSRETSFFSQGPWSRRLHSSSESGDRQSTFTIGSYCPGDSVPLENIARSNTGMRVVSSEAKQDIMRQSILNNASLLFADSSDTSGSQIIHNSAQSNLGGQQQDSPSLHLTSCPTIPSIQSSNIVLKSLHSHGPSNQTSLAAEDHTGSKAPLSLNQQAQKQLVTTSMYIPISSESAPHNDERHSMPNETSATVDANGLPVYPYSEEPTTIVPPSFFSVADSASMTAHRDSLPHMLGDSEPSDASNSHGRLESISQYINNFENRHATPANISMHHQQPTPLRQEPFSVDEYQYEPANLESSEDSVHDSPFISESAPRDIQGTTATLVETKSTNTLGPGPVLIRHGSRASLRRKGTIERHGKHAKKRGYESSTSLGATTVQEDIASGAFAMPEALQPKTPQSMVTLAPSPQDATIDNWKSPDADSNTIVLNARISPFAPNENVILNSNADSKSSHTLGPDLSSGLGVQHDPHATDGFEWGTRLTDMADKSPEDSSSISKTYPSSAKSPPFNPSSPRQPWFNTNSGQFSTNASITSPSLFRQSFGSAHSQDVFSSFTSLNTTNTNDVFFTPNSSFAQINASASIMERAPNREGSNTNSVIPASSFTSIDRVQAESSSANPPIMPIIQELRPVSAPHPYFSDVTANLDRSSESPKVGSHLNDQLYINNGLRRAETLRSMIDTDAPEIESALQLLESNDLTEYHNESKVSNDINTTAATTATHMNSNSLDPTDSQQPKRKSCVVDVLLSAMPMPLESVSTDGIDEIPGYSKLL